MQQLPKHAQLRLALEKRLLRLGCGEALPTIAVLQAEYGLALGTVTRVLRELQADGLVEARHGRGVYATGQTQLQTIAIYFGFDVLAPRQGEFPRLLLQGLEAAAGEFSDVQFRHYFASGAGVDWHRRVCVLERDVREHVVDGIIAVGVYTGAFADLPVPVVALNAPPGVTAHVALDNLALIRLALEALKARGCRRVGLLGPLMAALPSPEDMYYDTIRLNRERVAFFQKEVKRLGLTTRSEWRQGVATTGIDQVVPAGVRAFTALWQVRTEKPEGLVCSDDYVATGALQGMRELGLVPGRDIQVATHANRGSAVLAGEPVERIEFDPTDVARVLLQTVHDLVAGRPDVPKMVLVPPRAAMAAQ